MLEKTFESPLDCREIQPVHSKGDRTWVFFGRHDAKAETPVLWPPHVKSWLIGKDSDARRDWGQEEKGTTEDEMAGWHHRLSGRESEWTLGVGDGQGGLACCSSWGREESDTTEWLTWTELIISLLSSYKYILWIASSIKKKKRQEKVFIKEKKLVRYIWRMWPKIRREGRSEGLWEDTWFAEPIFDNGFKASFFLLDGLFKSRNCGEKKQRERKYG